MLTKALFLSAAIVAALSLPASAGGPGGDDRGTRTVVLQRGGWDGNGPDMLGTAADDVRGLDDLVAVSRPSRARGLKLALLSGTSR